MMRSPEPLSLPVLANAYQVGIHPGWPEMTKTIGETIGETDAAMVGEATVDKERSEKQTKTVLRLVGYHGVGSVRK